MSLEVRWPERTCVEIPDSWERFDLKGRRCVVSSGRQSFTILSRSKMRDQIIAEHLKQQVEPKPLTPPPPEPPPRPEPKPEPPKPQPVIEPEPTPVETAEEAAEEAAEMFHESVDEPLFQPSPEDWFSAVLERVTDERGMAVWRLSNGETCVAFGLAYFNAPGGHWMCLPAGTQGALRMERRRERNYFALEVRLEDEWDEREETGIAKFSGARGWVTRPCGCEIYISHVSGLSDTPHPGDAVSFRTVASTSHRPGFVGVSARVIERVSPSTI